MAISAVDDLPGKTR